MKQNVHQIIGNMIFFYGEGPMQEIGIIGQIMH